MYKYSSYVKKNHRLLFVALFVLVGCMITLLYTQQTYRKAGAVQPIAIAAGSHYPVHKVIASMFYVGEPADSDNGDISNVSSAWDDKWQQHFGGVDMPDQRSGWQPAHFTPKQNPFYIALPYNDLDEQGQRKASAKYAYWYDANAPAGQSLLKDRWVKICHGSTCAYGQWEDVGPFGEDDVQYVFGNRPPSNTTDLKAGIDLSPALNDYLQVNGDATVTWQFVDQAEVPTGPWLNY